MWHGTGNYSAIHQTLRQEAHNKTDIFFSLLYAVGFSAVFISYSSPEAAKMPFYFVLYICALPAALSVQLYGNIVIVKQMLPKKLLKIVKECYQHLSFKRRRVAELNDSYLYREDEHSSLIRK